MLSLFVLSRARRGIDMISLAARWDLREKENANMNTQLSICFFFIFNNSYLKILAFSLCRMFFYLL